MTTNSAAYLTNLHQHLNQHFTLAEIQTLCFKLHIDYESIAGEEKPSRIRELLLVLGRNGRLPDLITLARQERPNVDWPPMPSNFVMSATDVMLSDKVRGDKITVGNVESSYAAIGAGAKVIVNYGQQALSAIDEMEKGIQVAERRLAEVIQSKLNYYSGLTNNIIDDRNNPYKALLDYKLEDAPFFFGRTNAINAMLEKMRHSRLTILHSESGSGKTSLLQAGLASRLLADGHFPLYVRPYKQPPIKAIKTRFLTDYDTLSELQRFRDDQMALQGFLERVTTYIGGRRLYIFLDQFEEFFTELNQDKQQIFAEQLHACVTSELHVFWVLSVRKEFFSDLHIFHTIKPFDNEYFLPTFNLEEAHKVIVEPAARMNVQYEAVVVDSILKDIRQHTLRILPAQVQLVCFTLFEELQAESNSNIITQILYLKPRGRGAPGAEGILTSHLNRVLNQEFSGKTRQLTRRVLQALVSSQQRRVVKSRYEILEELQPLEVDQLDEILSILTTRRLLRVDEDSASNVLYELSHDYLLTEIDLDPEVQARKAAQELLIQGVQNWHTYDTLLTKEILAIIEVQREQININSEAEGLLRLSKAHHARRIDRVACAVVAGLTAGAVGVLLADILDWSIQPPADLLNSLFVDVILFALVGAILALGISLGGTSQKYNKLSRLLGGFAGGTGAGFFISAIGGDIAQTMILWGLYGIAIVYILNIGNKFEPPKTVLTWALLGGLITAFLGYIWVNSYFFAIFGILLVISLGLAEKRFKVTTRQL